MLIVCHYIYNTLLSLLLGVLRSSHKSLCNFCEIASNCLTSLITIYNIIFYFAAVAAVAAVAVGVTIAVVAAGVITAVVEVVGEIIAVVVVAAVVAAVEEDESDGLTANATSNIVVVSTEIKVSDVITQLHIWQSPVVKQSMLYIHKMTNGTVISV
jgi:hypothetical protein